MPCYFPLHAFKDRFRDDGKVSIVFTRRQSWRGEKIDLPCGQCIGCRLEEARQWAVRCVHEASLYERNCFLTLTYDDKYLPKNGSLCLDHFQKFMKKLRKRFGSGIRYFHCGEYGEINKRPHYHAIIFNHDFDDKKVFSKKKDYKLYTSDTLGEIWEKGFSVIGDVNFETANYVARYVLKKVTGGNAEKHYDGRTKEYITMSRGSSRINTGGIGKGWFDKFKDDVYPRDFVVVRGYPSRPPRYYDDLLGREDRSALALLKIEREKNGDRFVDDVLSNGIRIKVNDSSDSRLMVKEIVKRAAIENLRRNL